MNPGFIHNRTFICRLFYTHADAMKGVGLEWSLTGNNGQWWILALDGLSANDPKQTSRCYDLQDWS